MRVAELPLDYRQRDALARHLDRVGVAQLVGSEPPAHTSQSGQTPKFSSRSTLLTNRARSLLRG